MVNDLTTAMMGLSREDIDLRIANAARMMIYVLSGRCRYVYRHMYRANMYTKSIKKMDSFGIIFICQYADF